MNRKPKIIIVTEKIIDNKIEIPPALLAYLKNTLENYEKVPRDVSIVYNTKFRFKVFNFDYANSDIEQMAIIKAASADTYHVIRLKVVEENWIISKRENTSRILLGYLCDESEKDEDIVTEIIEESLMITTLETLDKISEIIIATWEKYKNEYIFEYKAYIVEHTFFNIFNQEKLLRNIYLPIKKVD